MNKIKIKLKVKLGLVVTLFCFVAFLNDAYNIFTSSLKVSTFIDRGAYLSIFLYVLYLVFTSFASLREKKGTDSNEPSILDDFDEN